MKQDELDTLRNLLTFIDPLHVILPDMMQTVDAINNQDKTGQIRVEKLLKDTFNIVYQKPSRTDVKTVFMRRMEREHNNSDITEEQSRATKILYEKCLFLLCQGVAENNAIDTVTCGVSERNRVPAYFAIVAHARTRFYSFFDFLYVAMIAADIYFSPQTNIESKIKELELIFSNFEKDQPKQARIYTIHH